MRGINITTMRAMTVVLAFVLCAMPRHLTAQSVTGSWSCGSSTQCGTVLGGMTGSRTFDSMEACDQWGRANIRNGYSCDGPLKSSGISLMGSSMRVLPATCIIACSLGAAGGSLVKDVNEKEQWQAGGLGALSAATAAVTMANLPQWNIVSATAAGAIAGASGAAAVVLVERGQYTTGSPDDVRTKDKVGDYALKGAEGGALAGAAAKTISWVVPKLGLNSLAPLRGVARLMKPMSLVNRGDRFGVRISW